jgi:hypothetical protein
MVASLCMGCVNYFFFVNSFITCFFGAITMLLTDRNFNTTFMILQGGGSCVIPTLILVLGTEFISWFYLGLVLLVILFKICKKTYLWLFRDGLCYDFNRCFRVYCLGPSYVPGWFRYWHGLILLPAMIITVPTGLKF